jgi:23S rRNA G2445 N2-methylase RlmL
MAEAMLDVKDETECIDSRFLEPVCGSGNFLGVSPRDRRL